MKKLIAFISLYCFLILSLGSKAQTINMPITGYNEITTDSIIIYDDGGESFNYSTRVNSRLTIISKNPNTRLRLKGKHELENWNFSRIIIYDGDTNSSTLLYRGAASNYNVNIVSTTNKITIHFVSDSEKPRSGFELKVSECYNCKDYAYNINPSIISKDSTKISWEGGDNNTNWIIELEEYDKTSSNLKLIRKISSNTNYAIFDSLMHCQTYNVKIYTDCDTSSSTCKPRMPNKLFTQYTCPQPTNFIINSKGDSILVSWTGDENVNWNYELRLDSIIIDSGITNQTNVCFDSLIPNTQYNFKVWNNCLENQACNADSLSISTICPCYRPLFDSSYISSNSIFLSWIEPNNSIIWTVKIFQNGKEYISRTTGDSWININGLNSASNYTIIVYNDCIDSRDTNQENKYCNNLSIDFRTKCNCPYPEDINIINIDNNSISISWEYNFDAEAWIIEYKKKGNANSKFDTSYNNFYTIENIETTSYYEIWVHSLCDSLKKDCSAYKLIINTPSSGNCLDFSNFNNNNTSFSFGSFDNPFQYIGIRDFGYISPYSRHSVHYDKQEKDPRTGNQLKCVPEDKNSSIRLGNSITNAEAETITYRYSIDTNNYDLIILNYALVFQDPEHDYHDQPRFIIEILDSNFTLIDTLCSRLEITPSDNLDWIRIPGSINIWKDWTYYGIDLGQYHSKTINIRLSTYDCSYGGHFGYAYFTLDCGRKNIISKSCGRDSTNQLIAPKGFNYYWYSPESNNFISSQRSVDIVSGTEKIYCCEISSKDNPNCKFTLKTKTGYRFPKADFDYSYKANGCQYEVNFNNLSSIIFNNTEDKEYPCDNVLWIFDDGYITDEYNPKRVFKEGGEYNVKLIAYLGSNLCADTIIKKIILKKDSIGLSIIGDSSLCKGESTKLTSSLEGDYYWSNGETSKSISITPINDIIIYLHLRDNKGCINRAFKNISINPIWDSIYINDTICDNQTYSVQDYTLNQEGSYVLNLKSIHGCDSIVYLDLHINNHYRNPDTIFAYFCSGNIYNLHGLYTDSSGVYESVLVRENGCDSILTINLIMANNYYDTIKADIYKGNTYNLNGFNENTTGIYTLSSKTYLGCDSIIYLDLQVDNILFPNVVTPNGDGINDIFKINNLNEQEAFPENELIIFSRQGKIIYNKKNIRSDKDFWDPNQTNSPSGTYFFRFIGNRHDKKLNLTGIIEVLR